MDARRSTLPSIMHLVQHRPAVAAVPVVDAVQVLKLVEAAVALLVIEGAAVVLLVVVPAAGTQAVPQDRREVVPRRAVEEHLGRIGRRQVEIHPDLPGMPLAGPDPLGAVVAAADREAGLVVVFDDHVEFAAAERQRGEQVGDRHPAVRVEREAGALRPVPQYHRDPAADPHLFAGEIGHVINSMTAR